LRATAGVHIAATIEPNREDTVCRVGLRTRAHGVNARDLAARLGGGGHPGAAGATVCASAEETRNRILHHASSFLSL